MSDPGAYYPPSGMGPRRSSFHWWPVIIGAILAGVAAILLLILLFPTAFGLSSPTYPYRFGLFGGFFVVFFILILVFFIVRVAFWSTRASRYGRRYGYGGYGGYNENSGMNRPAMVARMRYAKGEITREQYDQIMRDLGRRPGPP